MSRRRISVDERAGVLRDRPEQHGEVRPRQAARLAVGRVVEGEPAHRLDAVADPRRLGVRVGETRSASRSPRVQLW